MKFSISLLLTSLYIISCNSTNKENTEGEKKKILKDQIIEQSKSEMEKMISKLVEKYNIKYEWNTHKYQFSIDYDSILETYYQLLNLGILKLLTSQISTRKTVSNIPLLFSYPSFYFVLSITNEHEETLRKVGGSFIIVVSISEINKIKFELEGVVDENKTTNIDLTISNNFRVKGKIITIVYLKE